jgi:hypothetical protein
MTTEREAEGFDRRTEMAREHLNGALRFISRQTDTELRSLPAIQDAATRPPRSLSDEERAFFADMADEFDQAVAGSTRFMRTQLWSLALDFSRREFGEEATTLALEMLRRSRTLN